MASINDILKIYKKFKKCEGLVSEIGNMVNEQNLALALQDVADVQVYMARLKCTLERIYGSAHVATVNLDNINGN